MHRTWWIDFFFKTKILERDNDVKFLRMKEHLFIHHSSFEQLISMMKYSYKVEIKRNEKLKWEVKWVLNGFKGAII